MLAELRGAEIVPTGALDGRQIVLAVNFISQHNYAELCWAACCAMLLSANGKPTTVEDAAALILGIVRDVPYWPDEALRKCRLNFRQPPGDGGSPLSERFLRMQIEDARKPIEVYWVYRRDTRTGHVGLVTGYDPQSNKFRLLDPLHDALWVTYDHIYHYNGAYDWDSAYWSNSFYEIGDALGLAS